MWLRKLKTECPSDRLSMKMELVDFFGIIGSNVDRAWHDLPPGEIGR
jgi:hypothetical protein